MPLKKLGTIASVMLIQFHKRNPVNLRPILGIRKDYNPKGLGLLLKAYTRLYRIYNEEKYINVCEFLSEKIIGLMSKGYYGSCWGYNFDWATPASLLKKFEPYIC